MPVLVLLETQGNQRYIFATNVLREIVGASEAVHRAGARWPMRALGIECPSEPDSFGNSLLVQPPVETTGQPEILLAASGKALILVGDEAAARSVISKTCLHALEKAPGMLLLGASVSIDFSLDGEGTKTKFHAAVRCVHERLRQLRMNHPPEIAATLQLPPVDQCASCGGAAVAPDPEEPRQSGGGRKPCYCASCLAKRGFLKGARTRLEAIFGEGALYLADLEGEGAKQPSWATVLHADGNGIGQRFLNFDEEVSGNTARDYIETYRRFCVELDRVGRDAAKEALSVFPKPAPLKPLILAGDDLTVMCDGARAVSFAHKYLEAFADLSASAEGLGGALTGAAGVAIVKPHHPFHFAYDLAEELTLSAKKIKASKKGASALDFHVSYDGGSDLEKARDALVDTDTTPAPLYGGPYAMTSASDPEPPGMRRLGDVLATVKAMRETRPDGEGLKLSRASRHALREAMARSAGAAKQVAHRLQTRHPDVHWRSLTDDGGDTWKTIIDKDGKVRRTVRDAMTMIDIEAAVFIPPGAIQTRVVR